MVEKRRSLRSRKTLSPFARDCSRTIAQGQLHLGYVLLNQKKYAEARMWLEKSARPGVAIPEVFYYLGLVAQEQNDDATRDRAI